MFLVVHQITLLTNLSPKFHNNVQQISKSDNKKTLIAEIKRNLLNYQNRSIPIYSYFV